MAQSAFAGMKSGNLPVNEVAIYEDEGNIRLYPKNWLGPDGPWTTMRGGRPKTDKQTIEALVGTGTKE